MRAFACGPSRRVKPEGGDAPGGARESFRPRDTATIGRDHRMTQLTYAGIGARATPPAILEHMTVIAAWLARKGWHLHSGGAAGADTAFAAGAPADRRDAVPALARLPGPQGAGLTRPVTGGYGPLPRHRGQTSSRVASLLARRQQIARAQCGNSRCRHAGTCPRSGGVVRRRGGHRRHRNEHPHRAGARHPCVEPGRAPPPCRLPAA